MSGKTAIEYEDSDPFRLADEERHVREVSVAVEEESILMRLLERANKMGLDGKRLIGLVMSETPHTKRRTFELRAEVLL